MTIILGENDDFLREREALYAPFDNKNEIAHIVPEKFRIDVNALTDYIGADKFKSGLCIEVSLSELLSIVPRKRRRADAYKTLITYLKEEQNITLIIKNNKR